MKNRGDFLDEAIAELEENDSLLYIDDNDIVKYKHTESEMQKIVNEGCDALYEEYKETDEFKCCNDMETPMQKAMRDAGMKESDFR